MPPPRLPPPPPQRHQRNYPPPSPAGSNFYTPPTTPSAHSLTTTPSFYKPRTPAGETEAASKVILIGSRRTSPVVWLGAAVCLVFSVLLILAGVAILIVFLSIKPRYPVFDVAGANLRAIYFDSAQSLNGDFSFVANFTNPNEKMDVRFEGVDLTLAFAGRSIAAGSVAQGFVLRRKGGSKVGTVRMVSSLVYLPLKVAMELQRKVQSDKVEYEVKGRFRVRAKVGGGLGFSYWLHSSCLLVMTSPPTGVLVGRKCTTWR